MSRRAAIIHAVYLLQILLIVVPARHPAPGPHPGLLLRDVAAADELRAGVRAVVQLQEADVVNEAAPHVPVRVLENVADGDILFKCIGFISGVITHSCSGKPAEDIEKRYISSRPSDERY